MTMVAMKRKDIKINHTLIPFPTLSSSNPLRGGESRKGNVGRVTEEGGRREQQKYGGKKSKF